LREIEKREGWGENRRDDEAGDPRKKKRFPKKTLE
jgi:hypothetical protein